MPKVDKTARPGLENQLELFGFNRTRYEHTDAIRNDGRETLARTSASNGEGTGSQGPVADDAGRGGTADEGRNGRPADQTDETGQNRRPSSPAGLGNGEGTLHSVTSRNGSSGVTAAPKNPNSYRIAEDDRFATGGLKYT